MNVKQLLKVVPLLSAVLMFSCNRENVVKNDSGNSRISFKISIPQGDPVTYSRIHDEDEWGIESLWMCEYKEEGGSWKLVKSPVDIKSQLQNTGPEYTYSKDLTDADKGVRKFVFVANEDVSGLSQNSTISELESKVASKTLGTASADLLNDFNGNKRIPMTGRALQNGNENVAIWGSTQTVTVELVRIVARIDIENKVPNLTITDVKLSNTNSKSYLFEKRDNGKIQNPTDSEKKNGVAPFASMPTSFANGKIMKKAFYLYEGNLESKEAAALVEVQGLLGGVNVYYRIPLWKEGKSDFAVVRNHLYKIVLGDGKTTVTPGTDIEITIDVDKWNEVTMPETFSIISAEKTSDDGNYDTKTRTLTVDKENREAITFTFKTLFKEHSSFTANAYTTENGTESASWITPSFSNNTLSITTQANSGAERTAFVVVKSNADENTKYIIKVIQKGNQQ